MGRPQLFPHWSAIDPLSSIFVVDGNGNPLLSNNGGTTQTIGLSPYSANPAVHTGSILSSLAGSMPSTGNMLSVNSSIYIAAGDDLKLGSEIVTVTNVSGIYADRIAGTGTSTTAAAHSTGDSVTLAP